MSKSRSWCFTLNNYTDREEARIKAVECRYIVFGHEVGEQGTSHLQGYLYFENALSFKSASTKLGSRCHLEVAKGSAQQNRDYCTKDGDFFEYGQIPSPGSRSDIREVKDMVMNGGTMMDVIKVATSYQSLRTAELLLKYVPCDKGYHEKKVYWFHGPTGTGKTRSAMDMAGDSDIWISGKNLQWWEGYYGQKFVIIDDFRGDFCTFHELLRILDGYSYRVQVKGSSCWLRADTIVITSPYHPKDVYSTIEDVTQLIRRISEIREFKK